MSSKELRIIKKKWVKSILVSLLFSLIFGVFLYVVYESNSSPFKFPLIIFLVIFGLVVLLSMLNVVGLLFSSNSLRNDLIHRKKVIIEIIIKDKKEFLNSKSNTYTYRLFFENNEFLNVYNVGRETYEKISIGDILTLECSKYGKWIIDIRWKSESIENKSYIK